MYTIVMNIPEETLAKMSSVDNLNAAMKSSGQEVIGIMLSTIMGSMLQKELEQAENNTIVISEAVFANSEEKHQQIVFNTLRNIAALVAHQKIPEQNENCDSCKSSEETQVETSQE